MANRHSDDKGVFALSIEQAVEYTGTRVDPRNALNCEDVQVEQYIDPRLLHIFPTVQSSGTFTSNRQHSQVFSSPPKSISPAELFKPGLPTVSTPIDPKAAYLPPSHLRQTSTVHPHKTRDLYEKGPELYAKVRSRSVNAYTYPGIGRDLVKIPLRSPINRPKTPTCPPPVPNKPLSKHNDTAHLFSHRHGCAARLLGELEENGWVCWEREILDVDAIDRDFGQHSRDTGVGLDVTEYIKLHDTANARRPKPFALVNRSEGLPSTLDSPQRPPSAPKMVRYTDQDEVEEPESEEGELTHHELSCEEKRVKAIKLAKRDHNKRQALFLADVLLENTRIQQFGP